MILYFSATGNSRFAAKRLGERLGDAVVDLLPMLRGEREASLASERPWVIVAPVYVENVAKPVVDWLETARLAGSDRFYFVFTTASTMGCSGHTARSLAARRGWTCMGSAELKMPTNYPLMFAVKSDDDNRRVVREALPRLEAIARHISAGEPLPEKPFSPALAKLYGAVGGWFYRFYVRPRQFYASDACISCGRCAGVCPMDNIAMAGDRPAWGGRCVHCMACVSACPREAVEYGKKLRGKRRYHFPSGV